MKKWLPDFKFMGKSVHVDFPHIFSDGDKKTQGLADPDASEIKIGLYLSDGRKMPWEKVLHTIFHEMSHMADEVTRQETWTDDDIAVDAAKENALDAFWSVMLAWMLENHLLNPLFLERVKKAVKET